MKQFNLRPIITWENLVEKASKHSSKNKWFEDICKHTFALLPKHFPFYNYDKEYGHPRGSMCCKKEDETNLRKKNIVKRNEQKWIESGSVFFHKSLKHRHWTTSKMKLPFVNVTSSFFFKFKMTKVANWLMCEYIRFHLPGFIKEKVIIYIYMLVRKQEKRVVVI